ncbi:B3/4 domain-containing protein [Pacificispira sp.]|uniref:B3/B4 domain-containing protein n=1 Tax=Pacificispira sp. TaxID=2888761 RepID=UPI003BA9165D
MKFTISPILETFPTYRVAVLLAEDLTVAPDRGNALDALIAQGEAEAAERFDPEDLGGVPAIADWRRAYRDFGIKQTKYRSSVERLLRSAVKGRGLPRINRPVDAYNLISIRHLAPIGADDLDRVDGDLAFRFAAGTESFLPLGKEDQGEDPPKPGEVVYADAAKVLCRRWNWYQDGRSCISPRTRRAVVTLQSLGHADVEAAAEDLSRLWRDFCGVRASWQVADAARPDLTFES